MNWRYAVFLLNMRLSDVVIRIDGSKESLCCTTSQGFMRSLLIQWRR